MAATAAALPTWAGFAVGAAQAEELELEAAVVAAAVPVPVTALVAVAVVVVETPEAWSAWALMVPHWDLMVSVQLVWPRASPTLAVMQSSKAFSQMKVGKVCS